MATREYRVLKAGKLGPDLLSLGRIHAWNSKNPGPPSTSPVPISFVGFRLSHRRCLCGGQTNKQKDPGVGPRPFRPVSAARIAIATRGTPGAGGGVPHLSWCVLHHGSPGIRCLEAWPRRVSSPCPGKGRRRVGGLGEARSTCRATVCCRCVAECAPVRRPAL